MVSPEDALAWYTLVAEPWIGYAIVAAIGAAILLGIILGILGGTYEGKEGN